MGLKKGSPEAKKYMAKIRAKKVGSTLLIEKGESTRKKPTKIVEVQRTKKGLFKKFKSISGVKKHDDKKSHNVNIKVVSGFKKFHKYKGFVIDEILKQNGKEYAINKINPLTKKEVYYGSYNSLSSAKKWIDRTTYLLKTLK